MLNLRNQNLIFGRCSELKEQTSGFGKSLHLAPPSCVWEKETCPHTHLLLVFFPFPLLRPLKTYLLYRCLLSCGDDDDGCLISLFTITQIKEYDTKTVSAVMPKTSEVWYSLVSITRLFDVLWVQCENIKGPVSMTVKAGYTVYTFLGTCYHVGLPELCVWKMAYVCMRGVCAFLRFH